MEWFLLALKKYAVFEGRSRRKEFWNFILFYIIFYLAAFLIDNLFGFDPVNSTGLFTIIFALAMIVPNLSVSVRRLHDTGRSGWWVLLGIIPIVGSIVLIIFYAQDSQPGTNEYGPNPKEEQPEMDITDHLVD